MATTPSTRLAGGFQLIRPAGTGGFGTVWLAKDRRGEQVAVKILNRVHAADPEIVRRFEQEAQLGAAIRHPNVVRLIGHGRQGDQPFLVMEWVEGPTLRQELDARGPRPPARAVAIMRQVLAGLTEIHRHGIILLDFKPANILLDTASSQIKIADFGASCRLGEPYLLRGDRAFGTPAYMAPEQRAGAPVVLETDIYAAGVVLFELIAGRLPDGPNDVPHPATPPALVSVIRRALAPMPEDRFRSAGEMERALEKVLATLPASRPRRRPVAAGLPPVGVPMLAASQPPQHAHVQAQPARAARPGDHMDHDFADALAPAKRASRGFERTARRIGGRAGVIMVILLVALLLGLAQQTAESAARVANGVADAGLEIAEWVQRAGNALD